MQSSSAITLDATHFGLPKPTGVERYVDALLPLLTRELQSRGARVAWVGHGQAPAGIPDTAAWLSSPYRRFWGQTGLPKLLAQTRPDLFFTPSGIAPVRTAVKTAMTVHDLGAYEVPAAYSLGQRVRLKGLSRRAAVGASRIIVPSRYTAGQVKNYWKIDESRIVVVPEGYVRCEADEEPIPALADMPFFLFVGRLETKKNLLPLLLGFEKLIVERGGNVRLVLAGGQGFGYRQISREIARLNPAAESCVIETDYVTDGQKRWLYANAAAGVVPCPIEGFGLPVLDCFAAGIPVVCARAGALPEVGSDACLFAVPESPTDWYLQLRDALGGNEELVKRGRKYLATYDWTLAAAKTAEALQACL